MCGIFGYTFIDRKLKKKVLEKLNHRGPDSNGFYEDTNNGVTLIHTRLAITDETYNGNQPLIDHSGRYILIFNGEIYNHKILRKNLINRYPFRSNSDSEVILYGLIEFGVQFLDLLDGMYSIAFYDRHENKIILSQDKQGIKPLYYAYIGGFLIFSSEIEAMLESERIRKIFPRELISQFLDFHYILGDNSGIRDVYRLPSNKYLEWSSKIGINLILKNTDSELNDKQILCNDLGDEIQNIVTLQTDNLKNVGLYLSGGIDSTILLSCLKKTNVNLYTYSIKYNVNNGSDDVKFNTDAKIAELTSSIYKSNHNVITLGSDDLLRSINRNGMVIGDSFVSHPNSLAMEMLSNQAKANSKVVFSGSGADELFAGYKRYLIANNIDRIINYLKLNGVINNKILMKKLTTLLYLKFHSQKFSKKVAINNYKTINNADLIDNLLINNLSYNLMKNIMYLDRSTWLKNFSLALSDSTSMRNSIEERVPFLSNSLINIANSIGSQDLVDKFGGKSILKKSFSNALKPVMEMQSNKRGFSSPIGRWIRVNDKLSKEIGFIISRNYNNELAEFIDYEKIQTLYRMHLNGKSYQINNIWAFATLQSYISKLNLTVE